MDTEDEYVEYVRASLPRLHRAAYLLCGDADRADDIVQATALSLFRHWGAARAARNIDGYVHRILVRSFIDERRLSWSRVLLTSFIKDRGAPVGSSVEDTDELRSALAGLPRGQRGVLVLRFYCDLSVADTATALGCSAGSVKTQTARGLDALRGLLGGGGPTPGTPTFGVPTSGERT